MKHFRPTNSTPASSDLHLRLIASAALNGDFTGLPLNVYGKVDWIDAAQWLADVAGEPADEAQALRDLRFMLERSDMKDRWDNLPGAVWSQYPDFETWIDCGAPGHLSELVA